MSWISRAKQALGLPARTAEGPWGEGLIDEGWDGLAGSAAWDTVAADELLFLMPGLRPGGTLPPAGRDRLLPLVTAARLRLEAEARPDAIGRASRAVVGRAEAELAGTAPDRWTGGLVEAGMLGFETGLNGAYAVPAADLVAETLAACAFAGLLCRGRDAWLAPVLAPALADMLAASPGQASGSYGVLAALTGHRIAEAGLSGSLARALRRVGDEGRAVLVRGAPAPRRGASSTSPLPADLASALETVTRAAAPEPVPLGATGRDRAG